MLEELNYFLEAVLRIVAGCQAIRWDGVKSENF